MQILGIDVGGSGIKGAIVNTLTGELLTDRHRIITPQPATPAAVTGVIAEMAHHFNWVGRIGCGFPSVVINGVAQTAANIDKTFIGTNVAELIRQATKCPTTVVNDADAAGCAEVLLGAGQSQKGVVLMLTFGTGIGSALFKDSMLVPNTEFGHLIFKNNEIAEKYCSSAILEQQNLGWEVWGNRVNEYLQYVERLLNPELIIFGGGISKDHKHFFHYLHTKAPILPAKMKNRAGIIGAALSATQ